MTRLSELVRAGGFLTAGTIFQIASGIGANIYLARSLSPAIFGQFAVTYALAGLVFALFWVRVDALILRVPLDQLSSRWLHILLTVLSVQALTIAVIACLLVALLQPALTVWDVLLVGSLGLSAWCAHNRTVFERGMGYGRLVLAETFAVLLGHATAIAIVVGGGGLEALYLREIATAAALFFGLLAGGALSFRPLCWPDHAEVRHLFREALPIMVDGALEALYARLPFLLTGWLSSPQQTGILFLAYGLAARPQQLFAPVVIRLSHQWFGRTESPEARRRGLIRLQLFSFAAFTPAAILAIVAGDPLIPMILGAEWRPASLALAAMFGVILFVGPFDICRIYSFVTLSSPVVVKARVAQYAAFFAIVGLAVATDTVNAVSMSWALSAGAFFAFAALIVMLLTSRNAP